MARTRCLRQHTYDVPAERLAVLETVDHTYRAVEWGDAAGRGSWPGGSP
jgi:hypothetical protein